MNARDLDEALEMGMDWSLREGYVWPEDKEHCEEYGRMLNANPACVSTRAKKRGLPQLGTLGAGNHYAEIQVLYYYYLHKPLFFEECPHCFDFMHIDLENMKYKFR